MSKTIWELNTFDTDIFGFRAAKILSISHDGHAIDNCKDLYHTISRLIDDLKKADIAYATYRFPSVDIGLIHALETQGFRLIDGYLELQTSLKVIPSYTPNHCIVPGEEHDIPALDQLVRPLFTQTRFYNDPLTRPFAGEVFARWITNSVKKQAADEVYIWKDTKNIAGFVTLKHDGHLPLVGVSPQYRGKQIGRQLVIHALQTLAKRGVKTSQIETQSTNIAALRTYQSCGFMVTNSYVTFRWTV